MTLVWRPGFQFDADASNYIEAVEAADEAASPGIGALETGVRYAINDFVIGCKSDGIWDAIKASCILAGAKTRIGALTPLAGASGPDSFFFVDGDYDRKTGLVGNGSTKYLNSNRAENADPADSFHISTFVTNVDPRFPGVVNSTHIGVVNASSNGTAISIQSDSNTYGWSRSGYLDLVNVRPASNSLFGIRRTSIDTRIRIASQQYLRDPNPFRPYITPGSLPYHVFALNNNSTPSAYCQARLAFYSIGESLDLAALDTRVSALITAIGAAIP